MLHFTKAGSISGIGNRIRIHFKIDPTKAGKEARAYAEVSADGGEEVHDVHGLIPGLVVHHPQGGERAPVRRPEVPLVVAEHSLYVLVKGHAFS